MESEKIMKKRQVKKPCKYCGGLTNGGVCGHCVEKLELIRNIQTMVRNKIKEVRDNERNIW